MGSQAWTDERLEALRRLWRAGATAAAIAAALGVSRSGVLGKIDRLRRGAAKRGNSARRGTAGRRTDAAVAKPKAPARRRGAAAAAPPIVVPLRKRKTVFDLTNTCCRWPYQQPGTRNFFFCGASGADLIGGLPYCPRHMRRAYLIPPTPGAPRQQAAPHPARPE